MFKGAVLTAVPVDQLEFVGYIVAVTGGTPRQVLTAAEANNVIGWSTDSRAVLFIDPLGSVTEKDVDTLERTVVGRVPDGYDDGVWRIP
jgi:hypothetical protein